MGTLTATDERLIAGCLASRIVYDRACALGLKSEHFAKPHLFAIFARLYQLAHKNEPFEKVNILPKLPEYLRFDAEPCVVAEPLSMNLEVAVESVKVQGAMHRVMQHAADLHRLTLNYKDGDGISEVTRIVNQISDAANMASLSSESAKFGDLALQYRDNLSDRVVNYRQGKLVGIPTGIRQLDDCIYGWNPGALYTVAARAGVGKTTLACNIAIEAALRKYVVVFYTVEMSAEEILEKKLSRLAKVDISKMILGSLTNAESAMVEDAIARHADLPIFIRSLRAPRLDAVLNDIRTFVRREKASLVIVDYVQLIKSVAKGRARHEEVSEITGALKELARELQVPIILLAQLNRKATESEEPDVTHLKDSGSIEQDSDVVLLIFKDSFDQHWLKVAKNRKGRPGLMKIHADLAINYFGEPPTNSQHEQGHWNDR